MVSLKFRIMSSLPDLMFREMEFRSVDRVPFMPYFLSTGLRLLAMTAFLSAAEMVLLARAMMMNPEVVLYDEPTAGLDPYNTKRIQESILKLKKKGVTSILVTHDMPTVYAVCDKVALLRQGRITEQFTMERLKSESAGPLAEFINGESI
mgnify:CR=1 FL=1